MTEVLTIKMADYTSTDDARALAILMQGYSSDPMGGGEPLAAELLERLPEALAQFGSASTLLAYWGERPVGLATAIRSFSTFRAQPLLNLHDFFVQPEFRGRGVAVAMLSELENVARAQHCCKLTLEVLAGNHPAQALYRRMGFVPYELDEQTGHAMFWQKTI